MSDAFNILLFPLSITKFIGSRQINYSYLDPASKYYASDWGHIIFDALLLTFEELFYWAVSRADYLHYS
jgi:hypothetical protein